MGSASAADVAVGDGVSDGTAAVGVDGAADVADAGDDDDVALLSLVEEALAEVAALVGVVDSLNGGALGVLVGATAGTNAADDGGTV